MHEEGLVAMSDLQLSDHQQSVLWGAACALPPESRLPFLEHVARELATLPIVGDGNLHRVIAQTQRLYFEPPSSKAATFEHHGPRESHAA
jgi:hypothetical protein